MVLNTKTVSAMLVGTALVVGGYALCGYIVTQALGPQSMALVAVDIFVLLGGLRFIAYGLLQE